MMAFNLDGEFKLDDERRIGRRLARWDHAQLALEWMEAEADAAAGAVKRLRRELELLEPYWCRTGVTREQAVEAYYNDHPEDEPNTEEE
jgi:hypothetical protein